MDHAWPTACASNARGTRLPESTEAEARAVAKKILVLSHAGVLEVNRGVFREMAALGNEIVMIVPAKWKGDLIRILHCEANDSNCSLRLVPRPVAFSGRGSLFFYRTSLRAALAGWQPDVIFLDEEPWSLAALQVILEFAAVPVFFFTKENLDKWIPWPFSRLERSVYRRAAGAFAVSTEVEEVLRKKGFRGAVQQLHHSYDPRLFKLLSKDEKASTKQELRVPAGAIVIGYFGRLTADKGLLDLASALNILSREADLPPWFFLCVGNGPARESTSTALSGVPPQNYGMHPALPHDLVGRALGIVDILVLPSRTTKRWKEQFGRVLVEAMACGAATVGSNSGEIPKLIARSGGGLIFGEGRPDELASCLVRLLRDARLLDSHRAKGRAYVESTLTHATVARSLAENWCYAL